MPQGLPFRSRARRDRPQTLFAVAEQVRADLEARHRPHGTILDPIFVSPVSLTIDRYSRGGDSAIWTGHYLAAETYRWVATAAPDALNNVRSLVRAIRRLFEVTGTGLLARVALPADSPWAPGVAAEESANGIDSSRLDGRDWIWVGNTSRDQYLGVFFGLSVAFEWIVDDDLRLEIRDVVTRALEFLLDRGWTVRMPGGEASTTFSHRVDQKLALLQVGRQVNDPRFSRPYRSERFFGSLGVITPILFEVADPHSSYFKFNLVAIGMFCLIRSELSDTHRGRYLSAYRVFRRTVDDHGNAHFDMIDRALEGPDPRRDDRVVALLREWTRRPRRDFSIDFRGKVALCGDDRACDPLPVVDRVRTDFVWQRSPFQIVGGGGGFIETAGVDFLLPYWMGRVYGTVVNTA